MTATVVDGHQVIADEPARSPIANGAGQPMYFQQIRKLLLDNGSELYGCVHCDYARPRLAQVRPHLKKHRDRAVGTLSVAELVDRLAKLERLTRERDGWRTRALKAEHALSALRRVLGGTT